MTSPFPSSTSAAGEGQLIIDHLPQGSSSISTLTYQYPLKLISPFSTGAQKSVLVFLLTYGGGLVGGDALHLSILVEASAKLSLVTQGHTKIFKSPTRDIVTRQQLDVVVEADAAVCLLPDPVQPFAESVYQQTQIFTIHAGGSLCMLDWVSAGRTARGENWDLSVWRGLNEIWTVCEDGGKRLLLRDNIILDNSSSIWSSMHGHCIFGTLILRGPAFEQLAAFFLAEFAALPRIGACDFRSQDKKNEDERKKRSRMELWRDARLQLEKEEGLLWSAASVRGCVVVKFGARRVEGGRMWIGEMIGAEGSVAEGFGGDALMCVR